MTRDGQNIDNHPKDSDIEAGRRDVTMKEGRFKPEGEQGIKVSLERKKMNKDLSK